MGQYYKAVCIDDKSYLESWSFHIGAKLLEHSYIGNDFTNSVTRALKDGGPWHNKRLVWSGDYADAASRFGINSDKNLYFLCDDEYDEISDSKNKKLLKSYKYFINTDKKEYINLDNVKEDNYGFRIYPLALLTADGNGQGGGDYFGTNIDYIGRWTGDHIISNNKKPKDMVEIVPDFTERS